jgi:protein transport protein SEC61 subunit beta
VVQTEAKEHKMPANRSSKSGGARGRSRTNAATRRAARGGTVGQRKATPSAAAGSRTTGAGSCSARKMFYTNDSAGIKVGPVPVLIMALLFIASVFMLHIWGKYVRS